MEFKISKASEGSRESYSDLVITSDGSSTSRSPRYSATRTLLIISESSLGLKGFNLSLRLITQESAQQGLLACLLLFSPCRFHFPARNLLDRHIALI